MGARLRKFGARWDSVTDDAWVLDTVTNGLLIDFVSFPEQDCVPGDIPMTELMSAVCDAEIISLLEKRSGGRDFGQIGGFRLRFLLHSEKYRGPV